MDSYNKGNRNQLAYTQEERVELSNYVYNNFGPIDKTYNGIKDLGIKVEVHEILPNQNSNFLQLITCGAGAYIMDIPDPHPKEEFQYAEYVFWLPADWNFQSSRQEDLWPLNCLMQVASLPFERNGWVGPGHSLQITRDGSGISSNARFNSLLLVDARKPNMEVARMKMSNGKIINFYHIIPLYPEEADYLYINSIHELAKRFADMKLDLVMRLNRPSAVHL